MTTDNQQNQPQIPLAKPDLGTREEELVLAVLRSGQLSLGEMGERFEREFAAWLGVEDASRMSIMIWGVLTPLTAVALYAIGVALARVYRLIQRAPDSAP